MLSAFIRVTKMVSPTDNDSLALVKSSTLESQLHVFRGLAKRRKDL
jgi:hypothetical protein